MQKKEKKECYGIVEYAITFESPPTSSRAMVTKCESIAEGTLFFQGIVMLKVDL